MTAERDRQKAQALSLHIAGEPVRRIAEVMDLTEARVRKLISDGLDESVGDTLPDRARTEIARIDRMIAGLWHRAEHGDEDAIDRVIRLHERRERLATPRVNTEELTKAYDRTVKTSKALIDGLDDALIEMGRKTVVQIDRICATGNEIEIAKALYLQPHVVKALREMLATPAARAEMEAKAGNAGKEPEGTVSKLAQLRSVAGGKRG